MIEYENYLGRDRDNTPNREEFETELKKLFKIEKTDDSGMMVGYFAKNL